MYRTFDQISIHKPVTSRPANSERYFYKNLFFELLDFFSRYIICKGLRGDTRDIVRAYMYEINGMLNKYGVDSEPNDVQSIVPMNILKENEKFYEYIRNSNNQ
jgi:cap1 methyltransferase